MFSCLPVVEGSAYADEFRASLTFRYVQKIFGQPGRVEQQALY